MPRIIVYGPADIPFVSKVRGGLTLKKLDYELVEPTSQDDYRRWNPETGLLPVMDLDGERVPDSSRILDVLDERFPEPPLVAADAMAAQAQRRLEQWVEAAFMFYWIHYLRRLVNAEEGGPPPRPGLAREFPQRLDDLVLFLGDRPYFHGAEPSRADLAVYGFLRGIGRAVGSEVENQVTARGPLEAHRQRMKGRLGF